VYLKLSHNLISFHLCIIFLVLVYILNVQCKYNDDDDDDDDDRAVIVAR
jgi:hypothetical protein